MSPKIAGLEQLLGSPITAALLPTLKQDSMISLLSAWPPSLLSNDFIIEVGAPYDIEQINALDYLKSKGMIKSGDKIALPGIKTGRQQPRQGRLDTSAAHTGIKRSPAPAVGSALHCLRTVGAGDRR